MKDNSALWVEKLQPLARPRTYQKGDHIFTAQTPADHFYYILEGEVRIYKLDSTGREIEVRRAGSGDIFAEVLVFAGGLYPVSAQAVNQTRIFSYAKTDVFAATRQDNGLALFFIQTLAKRCLFLNQAIENVSMQDLPVRLGRFLINYVAEKNLSIRQNQVTLELPFAKKDLANRLGTIPETLSRTFSKLQNVGLITVSGRKIHLHDVDALSEMVQ